MSRDWPLFAADMLDFCRKVMAFSEGLDFETFAHTPKEKDALLLNIVLLGEAASHIPEDMRAAWTEIPWREVVATRNALVHGYFAINDDILWDIVTREIPLLEANLVRLLEQYPAD